MHGDLSYGFVSVAAGYEHSIGLRADGSLLAWGWNQYGQADTPGPNGGFVDVSAGYVHSLALRADGSIVAWGCGSNNQYPNFGQCEVPLFNTGFVAVAAGLAHSLALKGDGSVVAWGCRGYADGTGADFGQCDIPSPNNGFVAIAAGGAHSLGLKADGSIVVWGCGGRADDLGQCEVPSFNNGFVAIAAGTAHSLGLKTDGTISAWGSNRFGERDVPSPNADFAAIAAGWSHTLGLKTDGSIVVWGDNSFPHGTAPSPNSSFVAIAAGFLHNLGLKADGSIVGWGCDITISDYHGQCGGPSPNTGFITVAGGVYHNLALKADGSVAAWGGNSYGESSVPTPNDRFSDIAAGGFTSLGLRTDGSIVAWGRGSEGQTNVPTPNAGFVAVAGGRYHSLGLKTDGSVLAWGCGQPSDDSGQCNVPTPNTGFIAVAGGLSHSLGLKTDGSVLAWGCGQPSRDFGQCNVPAPNTGFVAIAAGGAHSLGLRSDGSLVGWGCGTADGFSYDFGQCQAAEPNTNFVAVAAGYFHSMGLRADGTVAAWGSNQFRQAEVPEPNGGIVAIAAGPNHNLAIRGAVTKSVRVTPATLSLNSAAGSASLTVSNRMDGTMPWSAAVMQGSSWMRITSGFNGINDGTILVAYDANPTTRPRTGVIRVSAPGALPDHADVIVTQQGTAPPVVTDVIASPIPGTQEIEIRYTLSDPEGDSCYVWVEVSDDDGATWAVPASSFAGDIGPGIRPGTGKRIVWNAGLDLPNATECLRFRVSAHDGRAPEGMVFIPGGDFMMGDSFDPSEGNSDELPRHLIRVDSFYMDRYEVTNQQYADALNWAKGQGNLITVTSGVVYKYNSGTSYPYCSTTASTSYSRITWNGSAFGVVSGKENHPMVMVSWYGAAAYANWRSVMGGWTPSYDTGTWTCNFVANSYRLPTEAEWEYAARGGVAGTRFPWSDSNNIQHARANYYSDPGYSYDTSPTRGDHPTFATGNYPYTSPAGYFAPNGYGLFDMAGNAWEWCNDWYDGSYYSVSPGSNPTGPGSGDFVVLRGGSWGRFANLLRCAFRNFLLPDDRENGLGFRLALAAE
ncbi:MAG: SUMF1/EgtB/PvdO family nonheme iron enzyme [Planctomycetota bacterium]